MILLISIFGVFLLGIIVFGSGQVFMPLFKSLWELLDKNGANINQDLIENIFTIANSTPGVIGTKFAAFTGYLISNGQWWGWLSLLLTYLVFAIPSILMIFWAYKMIAKTEQSKYLKNIIKYLRPVIIGILLTLSIQLFISTILPFVSFNNASSYLSLQKSSKSIFFSGWRFYALIFYTIFVIPESFILYRKKVNLFILIIIHIIVGMIVFQPWFS